jgi:hypothetical protein
MTAQPGVVGDTFPPGCAVLEVRIGTLGQMFDAMDPSPFRERDLDPKAQEYIVEWAREVPAGPPLGLTVHLSRQTVTAQDVGLLRQALCEYFNRRALSTRRQLRQLLRLGRKSLLIGLGVLAVAMIVGDIIAGLRGRYDYGEIVGHSLLIGGWVALWRPLEILLYDWWPIRAEAQLFDRLSAMCVHVENEPAVDAVASCGSAA